MRRRVFAIALALTALGAAGTASAGIDGDDREYVVVYEKGADLGAARQAVQAVQAAGGQVVSENAEIGVATVRSSTGDFKERVADQDALVGAAGNEAIGQQRPAERPKRDDVEALGTANAGAKPKQAKRGRRVEPLSPLQWDMRMIDATPAGSYAQEQGSHKIKVGLIDTGIDGWHPDIRQNFDRRLSRNFTTDIPLIDGDCASDPDGSCEDPADVDENGHGTHVAGTIGSPLNGQGIGGVAPRVSLVNVNLRAG